MLFSVFRVPWFFMTQEDPARGCGYDATEVYQFDNDVGSRNGEQENSIELTAHDKINCPSEYSHIYLFTQIL